MDFATHKNAGLLLALKTRALTKDEATIVYNMEQGSEEWLQFRQNKITATDVTYIVGSSPYGGIDDVIKNKFGGAKQTDAMRRGIELEPVLAAKFQAEQQVGVPCSSAQAPAAQLACLSLSERSQHSSHFVQERYGVPCILEKGGTIVHPGMRSYLSASLDYVQLEPERCIVELKSWAVLPDELRWDTWQQAIVQLALSTCNPVFDWGEAKPMVVVYAVSPHTGESKLTRSGGIPTL